MIVDIRILASVFGTLLGLLASSVGICAKFFWSRIQELRQDNKDLNTKMDDQRREHHAELALLRTQVNEGARIGRVKDDYILLLRQWIVEKKDPPPPQWPDELIEIGG